MEHVLQTIRSRRVNYEALPFFAHLRDDALTPEQRLAFYPCMAHFILSFGDLNSMILRSEPTTDPIQKLVNGHTYEDDHHWPWYLEDLSKLGFDTKMAVSEMLRFLFSDATRTNRQLFYELSALILPATSVERLIIIEAIEETGNVLFTLMAKLASTLEKERGVTLRYCGDFHLNHETGHTMLAADGAVKALKLDSPTAARATLLVDRVFELFTAWTYELLSFSRQGDSRFCRIAKICQPDTVEAALNSASG